MRKYCFIIVEVSQIIIKNLYNEINFKKISNLEWPKKRTILWIMHPNWFFNPSKVCKDSNTGNSFYLVAEIKKS